MIPTDQSASEDATTLTVLSDSTDVHAAEGPSTEDFLRALAPETAPRVTVQTFKEAPEAKRPDLIQIIHFDVSEYDEHLPRLQELNRAGAGIFVTVNETNGAGRKAKDVQTCRAQMLDLDGAPLPTNWAIEPSIVVESSPAKYHVYWLLRDGDLARFTDIQEKLAAQYGGDPAVKDVARVMRLPAQ